MIAFIIISLIIIILFLLIGYANKLCKIVVYPKKKSYEDGYENQIKKLNLEDFYNSLKKEEITLKSDYGYDIKGIFIPNSNSNKCIILCHGITVNINYSFTQNRFSPIFSIFLRFLFSYTLYLLNMLFIGDNFIFPFNLTHD